MTRLAIAPWGESLAELAQAARAAEIAGLHSVWSSELHRSAFVPLAAMATTTHEVQLATGIALAFVRSPLVTALEALDLDELCGGRLVLGLGTGVRRLNEQWHGSAFDQPVLRLRETIAVVRAVLERAHLGERLQVEGDLVSADISGWRRPMPPARSTVPIYVAAVGPMMTRLAGEVADGWIAHELGSPAYLSERILPELTDGLTRAGRSRAGLTVVASACCAVSSDGAEARRWAARTVALYASVRSYQGFFAFHGFEAEAVAVQTAFRVGDSTAMADVVTDEMVDALTISGTPDDVRRRLSAYDGTADVLKLHPPVHLDDPETVRTAQHNLLEVLS